MLPLSHARCLNALLVCCLRMPAEEAFDWVKREYPIEVQQAVAKLNQKDKTIKIWQIVLEKKPELLHCIVKRGHWRGCAVQRSLHPFK